MASRRRELSCENCPACRQFKNDAVPSRKVKPKRKVDKAALKSQGKNDGLYEDVMLYVKDQVVTTRKRGRPKKQLAQVSPRPVNNGPQVIYVPSVKRGSGRFVPFVTSVTRPPQRNTASNLLRPTVKCMIQSATVQPNNKALFCAEALKLKQGVGKVSWPEDLNDLVATWDTTPENNMRELVKWLHSTQPANTNYPKIVTNVHNLMAEWDEPIETKIEQIGAWWLEDRNSQRKVKPQAALAVEAITETKSPMILPPKVVVEAEPNPLQHCSQWSSMTENLELREP